MTLLAALVHSIFLALSLFCSPLTYGTTAWRHHSNHSCHGCAEARDELAKIRLELIKREILEKLGLDAPPQVRPQDGFPAIPQVAKYLKYQLRHDSATAPMHTSFLADELMMPERKAERTIVLAERTPARLNLNPNQVLAHFKFSDELMSKLLLSVVLNIYLRKPAKLHPDSRIAAVQVLVKEVVKNGSVLHFLSFSFCLISVPLPLSSLEKVKCPLTNVLLHCPITGYFLQQHFPLFSCDDLSTQPFFTYDTFNS